MNVFSIHNITDIKIEDHHTPAGDGYAAFWSRDITLIDKRGNKTVIRVFAERDSELEWQISEDNAETV